MECYNLIKSHRNKTLIGRHSLSQNERNYGFNRAV